jgi:RNase H-fold protein (predicted Holliday junction resolvase)
MLVRSRNHHRTTAIVARLTGHSPAGISRIGVTGHRDLADPDAVRLACIDMIDEHRRDRRTDIIEIWSSLAEGADRIVARLVPAHAERLVVVLPLDAADYRDDFVSPQSRQEFDELLASAHRVEISGADPVESSTDARESAYERAGLAIVEQCDVLLALWDGGPSRGRGGTAETVRAARDRGRTVIHIPVVRAATS